MRLEIELRCILFPLIILEMFLQFGVHLWCIQLIGHDLERHTPVYIRSHSCQCMSEQNPSREVKGIVRREPRQDCVKTKIWGRVPKHFCSIEGPRTVASIILKWKKFGTTKALSRPVHQA